jgi:CheY-like chemotaxis protein
MVEVASPSKSRILIVDDDLDIRLTLTDFLEDEGYWVKSVENGREALNWLRSNPLPRLVLLDLMMPVMDGYLFRSEQKRDPHISGVPVVVMTARGARETKAIDALEVLPKPLDIERLMNAIRRADGVAAAGGLA